LLGLTNGDILEGNYFEATPYAQIQVGCQAHTDSLYTTLYGANTNGATCGTAIGAHIENNYFTTSGGSNVLLNAALNVTIDGNTDNLTTQNACFVNVTQAAINAYVNNNHYTATSEFCQGGAAETADTFSRAVGPNVSELDLATVGSALYFNTLQLGNNYSTNVETFSMTPLGPASPHNPSNNTTTDPYCVPAYHFGAMMIDVSTGNGWMCKADSVLTTAQTPNPNDGLGTWIKVF
jgi:hypothetical protein